MVVATAVHPEGPRYGASLVFLPGLWSSAQVWKPVASFLAHRGWAGTLLDDVRAGGGGIAARADRVAAHSRALASPPILVGHDAGATIALAAAGRVAVRALVLVSPLVPGARGTHALTWSRGLPWALVRRRPVGTPGGAVGAAFAKGRPPDASAASPGEDPRLLAELSRRRRDARPLPMPPTVVLRGGTDPFVSPDDARGLASSLDADLQEIPERGHWLIAPPAWQDCAGRIHRWLIQRLGEAELEFYAEAMADREES
jgi:pimeloyl-ACP methyl ester carboxylesterase